MTGRREFTKHEIDLLYDVSKAVRKSLDVSWDVFFSRHVGIHVGRSYNDNFRKGDIGQANANAVHRWLTAEHIDTAREIAPELFDGRLPQSPWNQFLERHGQYGEAEAVPLAALGLTKRSAGSPIGATLRLGQDFCFALEAAFAGSVLALEEHRGLTYGLPLGADGVTMTSQIGDERTLVPSDPQTGDPIALRESDDSGEHGYVFIIGDEDRITALSKGIKAGQKVLPRQLDQIAKSLSADHNDDANPRFALYRLTILFVA